MVVKLIGNVNGHDIILERNGDRWHATIPASLNGVFVVSLTAYDDAGNEAYYAKYVVTVDVSTLCIHLIPLDYYAELVGQEFDTELICDNFLVEVVHPKCNEGGRL